MTFYPPLIKVAVHIIQILLNPLHLTLLLFNPP